MGIIKAVGQAVGSALADQWLEAIEPEDMGDQTVFVRGVQVRKGRGSNTKGSGDVVSDGSLIHVYPNQFMMLVDGGKVVDYTAEEGYYKVENSSMPSLFNGQFGDALKESFNRIRFGGVTPGAQKVYYVNLQEIKGLKFGTRTPVNYFDNFYNAELFLRAHGSYSVKITDPLRFYAEVIPKNRDRVEMEEINEQYLAEFMEAFQTAINQLSADGVRISYVPSKGRELGAYMAQTLDEEWNRMRGMEIQSVGIASISYDEESQELINMRNKGAMMGDPSVREGYVQSSVAEGLKAAGSNSAGSMAGFMGMGFGMQADEQTLTDAYGVPAGSFEQVTAFFPMITSPDTVIIGKLAEGADQAAVEAALETYRQGQEDTFSWYLTQNLPKVQDARLVVENGWLLFLIADNADAGVEAFQAFVEAQG